MNSRLLCAAGAAALALMAGAATAQTPMDSTSPGSPAGPMSMPSQMDAPAAPDTGGSVAASPMTPWSAATDASTVESSIPVGPPGSVTTQMVTNGPVADTEENRARYGQPMSRAGRMTQPAGN